MKSLLIKKKKVFSASETWQKFVASNFEVLLGDQAILPRVALLFLAGPKPG